MSRSEGYDVDSGSWSGRCSGVRARARDDDVRTGVRRSDEPVDPGPVHRRRGHLVDTAKTTGSRAGRRRPSWVEPWTGRRDTSCWPPRCGSSRGTAPTIAACHGATFRMSVEASLRDYRPTGSTFCRSTAGPGDAVEETLSTLDDLSARQGALCRCQQLHRVAARDSARRVDPAWLGTFRLLPGNYSLVGRGTRTRGPALRAYAGLGMLGLRALGGGLSREIPSRRTAPDGTRRGEGLRAEGMSVA